MDPEQLITEYDSKIQTRELQMLKAMLPFLHSNTQMPMAFFIQAMEFKKTMQYFKDNSNTLSAQSITSESERRSAILHTIKKFCTPRERETIDTLLNIMCVMENYDKEETIGRFITQ